MTAEREAMTLERQAFEKFFGPLKFDFDADDRGNYMDSKTVYAWCGWQAAIKGLSRAADNAPNNIQQALNVLENAALAGVTLHGDDVPRLHASIDRLAPRAAEPVAEVKDSDALYDGFIAWRVQNPPPVGTKLYTHPPEPARDAKDAARLDWRAFRWALANRVVHDENASLVIGILVNVIDSIFPDAAMAQESGE